MFVVLITITFIGGLNFDVRDTRNNEIEEYNDPPILGSSNWHVIRHESKKPRKPANNRKWGTKKKTIGQRAILLFMVLMMVSQITLEGAIFGF